MPDHVERSSATGLLVLPVATLDAVSFRVFTQTVTGQVVFVGFEVTSGSEPSGRGQNSRRRRRSRGRPSGSCTNR